MLSSLVFRNPGRGQPLVLAAFSFRHDAHLVADLIANITPFVHGYVAWDDTGATQALTAETDRRNRLLAEARRLGANWILAVDPDERFEDRLAQRMPEMLAMGETNLWSFTCREMFTPEAYRCDGVWGNKKMMRLFPTRAIARDLAVALHGGWIADTSGYTFRDSRIDFYHLRMATAARRQLRRDLYRAADPARRYQRFGYDYLSDDRGMVLEPVPQERRFSPAFVEDHGLWSPEPAAVGSIAPDPMETRLAYVRQSAARQGTAAAVHVMHDLCAASPLDRDLVHVTAGLALTAGMADQADGLALGLLDHDADDLFALQTHFTACLQLGQRDAATEALHKITRIAPESLITRHLAARLASDSTDFTAADAWWRRWTTGPARCLEGQKLPRAEMAVVVIGHRAPADLALAVASLRAQDAACEIVVVNTGGGAADVVLADHLDHIRLIAVEESLLVGAARNIGIDASRADTIGFLAGDCQALPGWVSGRMRRHRAGAASVSTPVVAQPDGGLLPIAMNRLRYWTRSPGTDPAYVTHFGRSYRRWLFDEAGYFPTGLRVSEDDLLNRQIDTIAPPVWAADVLTRHRDPESLAEMLRDNRQRGVRRADHAPFRALAGLPDLRQRLTAEMALRRRAAARALDRDAGLPGLTRLWLKLLQQLASWQDRRGIAAGLTRLARADAAFAAARRLETENPAAALDFARQAAALDPQDWRKAHELGQFLAPHDPVGAAAAWRAAASLAPNEARPIEALVRLHAAQGAPQTALIAAEAAALQAPRCRRHWDLAADMALACGNIGLALAHARRALRLAPDLPWTHRRLAQIHRQSGDPLMPQFRNLSARRLLAAEAAVNATPEKPAD